MARVFAALPKAVPTSPNYAAAFIDFCHVLLNSNEFLDLD